MLLASIHNHVGCLYVCEKTTKSIISKQLIPLGFGMCELNVHLFDKCAHPGGWGLIKVTWVWIRPWSFAACIPLSFSLSLPAFPVTLCWNTTKSMKVWKISQNISSEKVQMVMFNASSFHKLWIVLCMYCCTCITYLYLFYSIHKLNSQKYSDISVWPLYGFGTWVFSHCVVCVSVFSLCVRERR